MVAREQHHAAERRLLPPRRTAIERRAGERRLQLLPLAEDRREQPDRRAAAGRCGRCLAGAGRHAFRRTRLDARFLAGAGVDVGTGFYSRGGFVARALGVRRWGRGGEEPLAVASGKGAALTRVHDTWG